MNKKINSSLLFKIYGGFFVNGVMALSVGAILPYVMEEKGINYSIAGSLLSAFAIGNFLASFIYPFMCHKLGRKKSVILMTCMIPICFIILSFLPPVSVLYLIILLIGIARGCCSIFSNAMVNDNCPNDPEKITLLHTVFAIGAFLAPFLMSLCLWLGFGWRVIIYILVVLWLIAIFFYFTIHEDAKQTTIKSKSDKTDYSFLKLSDFYIMGLLLFFYLGVENCVNGWFITYFKSSGIMSNTYANNLVSIVWIMVMAGRILNGRLSKTCEKGTLILINCVGTVVFFFLLIATSNLTIITISIVGLGFFLAGIYPTCIANLGKVLEGSISGMSYLLAMAALGGIITPKIVGMIADKVGMNYGIMILIVNVSVMCILAVSNYIKSKKKEVIK